MNSFGTRGILQIGGISYTIFRLNELEKEGFTGLAGLPYSLKILLENLLRHEGRPSARPEDIEALAGWDPGSRAEKEIPFSPARILMQDFTGVPAIVDLASMRDAVLRLGGDPRRINPQIPVDLIIDHSVQVDSYGESDSYRSNTDKEYERNHERYAFLRWGEQSFQNLRVVPPGTGICHQVNLEYLGKVVFVREAGSGAYAYPDCLVGTDSHTTMINGLGVLGWGVGGIEAEAAMLGQPISILVPEVIGFRLTGELSAGATSTDLVLTVTQMLRQHRVVGKFVEFCGPGLDSLSLADRATVANMSPEYGATVGYFPVDGETLAYLRATGREEEHIELVEAYTKEQGLFRTRDAPEPRFSDLLELDLSTVEPSMAGPKRPQDRIALKGAKQIMEEIIPDFKLAHTQDKAALRIDDRDYLLDNGCVVIAAITSCTNTSNPTVMLAAGLLAKKAVEFGLKTKPWVKTSLAPGSKVVTDYLKRSRLLTYLEELKFNLVGYGCTTCIGNSGPLSDRIARGIEKSGLVAIAVLSGNRNFEGRINPHTRANFLMSPPLVVAYALAGKMNFDFDKEPLGRDPRGNPIYLRDVWPHEDEIREAVEAAVEKEMFIQEYAEVFAGDARWLNLKIPQGDLYAWDHTSTYIKESPFFGDLKLNPVPIEDILDAKVLVKLGDSVTTDHISPAGAIPEDRPAGEYLSQQGIPATRFNSFGSRRGNHEVMIRGTFGNIRLRNHLVPEKEGDWTLYLPAKTLTSIYAAARRYQEERVPLIVLAGKEYGTGSSRDWAAKGVRLLGVRAVIAESYERIHRSNLVGMGVLPLQYLPGQNAETLGLTGLETFSVTGLAEGLEPGGELQVMAAVDKRSAKLFSVRFRVDTPEELKYLSYGGILPYVLRQLL